jgi:hypothetical protein
MDGSARTVCDSDRHWNDSGDTKARRAPEAHIANEKSILEMTEVPEVVDLCLTAKICLADQDAGL